MPTLLFSPAATGVTLVQLNEALWRVTRSDGDVLGYVECFLDEGEPKYRAKRMIVARNSFVSVGEFWVMDDAVSCFS